MPVSRSTFSALSISRSRAPATFSVSKTLVPFLYQTATIQKWNPIDRRDASSNSKHDDDIPFENATEDLPPAIDSNPSRKTTITGTERAAFEKLYKKFNTTDESKSSNEIPFRHEIDQIADEWYEEDEETKPESSSSSLDAVFDAVIAGLPAGHTASTSSRKPAENLKTLAEQILKPELEEARRKPIREARAEAARVKGIKEEENIRVRSLLNNARTDKELWEILEREVFDMIRGLDLDGLQGSKKQPNPTRGKKTTTNTRNDPRILFPNYPSHLIHATRILRRRFPSSQLPLSILPTMKSLGRSSYALGASTQLYNLLILTVWVQHTSFAYINELLTDMNNGGIEPDGHTLQLLDNAIAEFEIAQRGNSGETMKQLWRMNMFADGVNKLRSWRVVIAQRLGEQAAKTEGLYEGDSTDGLRMTESSARDEVHCDHRKRI